MEPVPTEDLGDRSEDLDEDDFDTDDELSPVEWAAAIALRLALDRSGSAHHLDNGDGHSIDSGHEGDGDDDEPTELLVVVRTRSRLIHKSYIALGGARIGRPRTGADGGPIARITGQYGYLKKAAEKLVDDAGGHGPVNHTLTVSDWRDDSRVASGGPASMRWEFDADR